MTPETTTFEHEHDEVPRERHEKVRTILDDLAEKFAQPESKISLRKAHLDRLIPNVTAAERPSTEVLAQWGTDKPILSYGENERGEGTINIYEAFETEAIDQEHAVTHEFAEALLASGLFRGTRWREVITRLDEGVLEDTGYVRSIRNELTKLDNPDHLATKAKEAGMEQGEYQKWMQTRVRHEQLAESLTFYLRSGGDRDEMLRLHMEHVPASSLPTAWREALDSGDKTRVAGLYKESGLEERNQYFFDMFNRVLGEQTPEQITAQLDTIGEERLIDEEYEDLLEIIEMEEMAAQFEPPAVAQPPKVKKEPSFWDHLKRIFAPRAGMPKFVV